MKISLQSGDTKMTTHFILIGRTLLLIDDYQETQPLIF